MARAGLQSGPRPARPTLRSRRFPHCHSPSWAFSPSPGPHGVESAKQPREDPTMGQLGSRRWCSYSRGRDRLRQHQSPLPQCPSRHKCPLLALHNHILPMSSSAASPRISTYTQDHSNLRTGHGKMMPPNLMKSVLLHKNPWRSTDQNNGWRSRSGSMWKRTLPPDLSTFLVGVIAKEWDDAPSPSTSLPLGSQWPPPNKGP